MSSRSNLKTFVATLISATLIRSNESGWPIWFIHIGNFRKDLYMYHAFKFNYPHKNIKSVL